MVLKKNILIYPNPTSGEFNLRLTHLPAKDNQLLINLISTSGTVVYQLKKTVSITDYSMQFDVHLLPKGIYALQMICNNEVLIKKVIIY